MDMEYRLVHACDMLEDLTSDGTKKREHIRVVSQIWNVSIRSINDEMLLRFIYTKDTETKNE